MHNIMSCRTKNLNGNDIINDNELNNVYLGENEPYNYYFDVLT